LEGHSSASAGGSANLTTGYGGDTRALAIQALEQIKSLEEELRSFKTASRDETQRKLDALRIELQEHVLTFTTKGWVYVVIGAVTTAVGLGVATFV
jgi:hypothetical protein